MPTLINVCGAGRSGTTILDVMLGTGENAFSCGEVYSWYRPWHPSHRKLDCPCEAEVCPVWSKMQDVPEDQFHGELAEQIGAEFIIDSSKDTCWVVEAQRWADRAGLRVYNLLLWKDPLHFAIDSRWKRNQHEQWYRMFTGYFRYFFNSGIDFVSVNYNELVESPSAKLRRICDYVGMPYFEGKEHFWNDTHHQLFGSTGTRRQIEEGSSEIRTRTSFPPEFDDFRAQVEETLSTDDELRRILAELRRREIDQVSEAGRQGADHSYRIPVVVQGLNYLRRLKRYARSTKIRLGQR